MTSIEIPQFMGVRIPRREDPALITGQGKYTDDIQLENVLQMAVVRSPYGHAKIIDIDISEAEALPGVVAVLTAADLNHQVANPFPNFPMSDEYTERHTPERYPLAGERVRYMGEPVAVVLAGDRYIAADAAELVTVDYDPLPVVTDPELALASDSPLIYEAQGTNVGFRWQKTNTDVEPIFAEAAHVIECRVVNQRLIASAMEPRAVLADYEAGNEALTVWITTQTPHRMQEILAEMMTMPKEQVRVIAPEVGGGFGVKGSFYAEEILVPLLARQYQRPIKWTATRSEDYQATVQGRGQIDVIRLAADAEGCVQAVDLKIVMDCGAYFGHITPLIPTLTTAMVTGVYTIPAMRSQVVGVFTNKQSTEPYRGAGRPEGILAIERAMDVLAAEMGLDATEIRRRNFIGPDVFPYSTATGAIYDSGQYEQSLDKALTLIDYQALRTEQTQRREAGDNLIGIGVACYIEMCGMGPFEMGSVEMDEQGQVTVLTGTSPHGQGHQTAWSQIAADVLQLPLEAITVKHGDTAVVPRGIGTFASRSAAIGGSAVFVSAEMVRDKAKQVAAHLLEAAGEDIVLQNGLFQVVGVPDRTVSWTEVAQATYRRDLPAELSGGLQAEKDYSPEGILYPFGTHICVVEIDTATGETKVIHYLTVDDCGKVINPMIVAGQVHGGIAQGVGQVLLEGVYYDELGNLVTGTLLDYALPRADDFPFFETNRTETPSPLNPLGVKGIGEAGTIGAIPAVINAVVDALAHVGVRNMEMPVTAQAVWQILHQ